MLVSNEEIEKSLCFNLEIFIGKKLCFSEMFNLSPKSEFIKRTKT